MKPRLLLSLLVCAALLTACYRQAEEPFQQIDSAEVVAEATTALVALESDADRAAEDGVAGIAGTPGLFITPETLPGQVEQPTLDLTAGDAIVLTSPAETQESYELPTPTLSFEEQLDPEDECVYTVQAGNVLFRLALAWGTTYQTIMDINQLPSEDLVIGQLLLIPDCESSAPEETAGAALDSPDAVEQAEDGVADQAQPTAQPTVTPPPAIHVVSAGETVASISLRYRVDIEDLVELNVITDRNRLRVGQELKLPPK